VEFDPIGIAPNNQGDVCTAYELQVSVFGVIWELLAIQ